MIQILALVLLFAIQAVAQIEVDRPDKITPAGDLDKVTETNPFVNSLGMRFITVIGGKAPVAFSVWDTRVMDYNDFAKDMIGVDGSWRKPGFEQTKYDPVVCVNWQEAVTFCKWLTNKERKEGWIRLNQEYRLPSDAEWSCAVGLGGKEKSDRPRENDGKIKDVYPWGTKWPPPDRAGNYGFDLRVDSYDDRTSPVGRFNKNEFGLYDMGGNAWQWCEDWYDSKKTMRVVRGASWSSDNKSILLSSCRNFCLPEKRYPTLGFRCVLAQTQ